MAPRFFSANPNDRNSAPLSNFIDLLIIDEAGQIIPYIAGATFGLAKKALVVGDLKQIEPVWSIPKSIDTSNLQVHGLLNSENKFEEAELSLTSLAASSGSVMQIAQTASYYQKNEDDRGLFLSEHRRCVPEIIDYCNQLAYFGRLEPKRASLTDHKNLKLPFMGYAHIPRDSEPINGSRQNKDESEVIATWVQDHQKALEEKYGKAIGEILGIVTPFSKQAQLIQTALEKLNIVKVTVGTVHALQGAEREVIIFSSVYHEGTNFFFDRGPNMLNVAVPRAKDSFLVFGNMSIFEKRPYQEDRKNLPSTLLARFLFRDEDNEITDIKLPERAFTKDKPLIEHIVTLQTHQRCLADAIRNAQKQVCIVSPFLSHHAINHDRLPGLIRDAVARGVEVVIYTDLQLNQENDGQLKFSAQKGIETLKAAKAAVKLLNRVHSKTICVDNHMLVEGSFNWLSASRDENYIYQRHETSIRYEGPGVTEMTQKAIQELEKRVIKPNQKTQ